MEIYNFNNLFFQHYLEISGNRTQNVTSTKLPSIVGNTKKMCIDLDMERFCLREILYAYSESKRFLRRYENKDEHGCFEHRLLETAERGIICKAIVDWALDNDICLRSGDFLLIFEQIKIIFPMELLSMYYTPSSSQLMRKQRSLTGSSRYHQANCIVVISPILTKREEKLKNIMKI